MTVLDEIPLEIVGERLRIAREAAKIKQVDAAAAIDVARTTIVAIEQGHRRVKIDELRKLASLYQTSVNGILRLESIHVELAPRFRKMLGEADEAAGEAAELLANLAKAEVELEALLGIKRLANYPPERPILRGDVRAQAEQDAQELRQRFGLGMSPVTDLVTLLEMEMGVRVYVRRLNSKICGLFAYDEAIGACILLNANHPRERRTQTGGHELGHLISTRRQPEVLHLDEAENSREERYANTFARAFLTPGRAVIQKCQEVTAGSDRVTRRHVIVLAHYFGVSREALVRRLIELELTKPGAWDWFQANGGITDDQARQVLGDLVPLDAPTTEANRPTTLRLNMLAAEAHNQGLLSEGQLARLLHLDRVELRELITSCELDGNEANGFNKLPD